MCLRIRYEILLSAEFYMKELVPTPHPTTHPSTTQRDGLKLLLGPPSAFHWRYIYISAMNMSCKYNYSSSMYILPLFPLVLGSCQFYNTF